MPAIASTDMPALLDRLAAIVGPRHVVTDAETMAPYLVEQRGLWQGRAPAVLRPGTTAEVAEVVAACAGAGAALVPQGGNTGLVGGQVPFGALLLSLSRLDRIRALDPLDLSVTVEAGCTLATLQAAASEAGCLFPLSIASEGSAQVGGALATNAGGTAVLRYGNMRDLALGLEVVLPDGRVLDVLSRLRKDNTGYDLKDLFIGAEGTLGVITAAVLKLYPAPRAQATAFIGVGDPQAALALLRRFRAEAGDLLTSFELMPRFGIDCVLAHIPGTRDPLGAPHAWYVLAELTSPRRGDDLNDLLLAVLGDAAEAGEVMDAALAASRAQAAAFWHLRETMSEAQKGEGGSIKHDISVPVALMADFIVETGALCAARLPGVRLCPFGHLGDGNIHFNLSQPEGMEKAAFLDLWPDFNRLVHDRVAACGGSISAEHGIGLVKREELMRYKSPVALDLMRRIKAALDPAGLMNPGKVLSPPSG